MNSTTSKESREETLRGWLQVSAISLLMFSVSFGLMKMIAQSPWTEARLERDRLSRENSGLVDKVIEGRQAEGHLDPAQWQRMATLRTELQRVKDALAESRRQERPSEERTPLVRERQKLDRELSDLKREIVAAAARRDDTAHYVSLARQYERNKDRMAELKSMRGFFYSTAGQVILILSGVFLSVVMWLGIGGIVFFSVLGGINMLLSSM